MCLTDERRKLVEDNHSLIYFALHKNNWSVSNYYDVAAIGLCRAAETYEPEKGAFSTYAVKVITNQVLMELRKESARPKEVSLGECTTEMLSETYIGSLTLEKQAMQREALRLIGQLPEREKSVALLVIRGYSRDEIAEKTGLSISKVNKIIRDLARKLRKCIE